MKILVLVMTLGLTACSPGRRDIEKEAARSEKKLDRQAAKARPAHAANWGFYSGPIETRWEDDGRTMVLLNELRYTDPYGVVWIAPAGSKVDGASIPRAFWGMIGGPFEGKYRNASVLHDVAYDRQDRSPAQVDLMFYNAMRCSGVGVVTAKTMYDSLVRHGRHWTLRQGPAQADPTRASAVSPTDVDEIQEWVRANDPSLNQIRARATGPQP